ncbi:MAG: WXG100 family type VII secretion target [Mycobacterium sp.]|nr:WXG100 family type VII secretion target [Mycobacterium sp.]
MGDSGETTRVVFGGMDAGMQNFMAAHKSLTSTLDEMEHDVEAKLAEWDGDARQEYLRAKAQWRQAADHMAMVVQNMGGAIGSGNENYRGAENKGVGLWSS